MANARLHFDFRIHGRAAKAALGFAVALMPAFIAAPLASPQTITVLYSFKGAPDGALPVAGLVRDSAGNLYGTTYQGGASDAGVVFKVDPTRQETVLYSFTGGADGSAPFAGVIRDSAGNLYGTANGGGAFGAGVVFKVDASGEETVLYSFTGGLDGASPCGGLLRDRAGNLYGTTSYGGASNDGVVFKLEPSGKEVVLHNFAGFPTDGETPTAGLIGDLAGNLYGTTLFGGSGHCASSNIGCGVIFKLTPSGAEIILHSFAGSPTDGANPVAGLIRDAAGSLYGTTEYGGSSAACGSQGCGAVFGLPAGGTEKLLHSFVGYPTDGYYPLGGLVRDAARNLYGTAFEGGSSDGGIVFKLDPLGTETVLYNFSGLASTASEANLILDSRGNLYGTTVGDGAFGNGDIFKLVP